MLISEEELIEALKTYISEHGLRVNRAKQLASAGFDDQVICREEGVPTKLIAYSLSLGVSDIRKALNKLHKQERVIKFSRSNCCLWWPAGYLSNPVTNPFHASGTVSVTDRLDSIKRMGRSELEAALNVNGLQATVELAIKRRLRKLNKEQQQCS